MAIRFFRKSKKKLKAPLQEPAPLYTISTSGTSTSLHNLHFRNMHISLQSFRNQHGRDHEPPGQSAFASALVSRARGREGGKSSRRRAPGITWVSLPSSFVSASWMSGAASRSVASRCVGMKSVTLPLAYTSSRKELQDGVSRCATLLSAQRSCPVVSSGCVLFRITVRVAAARPPSLALDVDVMLEGWLLGLGTSLGMCRLFFGSFFPSCFLPVLVGFDFYWIGEAPDVRGRSRVSHVVMSL